VGRLFFGQGCVDRAKGRVVGMVEKGVVVRAWVGFAVVEYGHTYSRLPLHLAADSSISCKTFP